MSRKAVVALIVVAVLILGGQAGTVAYLFLKVKPGAAAATAPVVVQQVATPAATSTESGAIDPTQAFILSMPKFVTDLADKDKPRYVDVTIAIAFKDQKGMDDGKKITPAIRDAILSHLRTKAAAELTGSAGMEKLAESVTASVKPLLKDSLKRVFVTDLITQ